MIKNLDRVFRTFPHRWNTQNTIIVDDSYSKVRQHDPKNVCIVPMYHHDELATQTEPEQLQWLQQIEKHIFQLTESKPQKQQQDDTPPSILPETTQPVVAKPKKSRELQQLLKRDGWRDQDQEVAPMVPTSEARYNLRSNRRRG